MLMQILSALFMVMLLVFLWPNARRMIKESPKGSGKQWVDALIPIGLVVLFVIFLTTIV